VHNRERDSNFDPDKENACKLYNRTRFIGRLNRTINRWKTLF